LVKIFDEKFLERIVGWMKGKNVGRNFSWNGIGKEKFFLLKKPRKFFKLVKPCPNLSKP